MTIEKVDVFVSGGGIAGMVATIAFEQLGYSVICADPEPPAQTREAASADLRTTAFLQPSKKFLENLSLWHRLAEHAMPLEVMRIADAGSSENPLKIRVKKDFKSSDISDQPFGWNVPNWLTHKELLAAINLKPNATFLAGVKTERIFTRDKEAKIILSNGQNFVASLVVGADGRNSRVRQDAKINVRKKSFGQKALAFAVTHPNPHYNVSTEIHHSGGPFTLVPLPNYQGIPSSAVVWMESSIEAIRLLELKKTEFEKEMTARSCCVLGQLKLATKRSIWPIVSQYAKRLNSQRVALVAEAAHVVPPIGAQGLNMSLKDIKILVDLAEKAYDIGAFDVLEQYHKARIRDIRLRVSGISLLNQTSLAKNQMLRDMRSYGINFVHSSKPIRKSLMRLGLGIRV